MKIKNAQKWLWLENLLVIVLLSGYVWMILRLFWLNKLTYYIHPDYVWMTVASSLLLLMVLVFVVVSLGFREKGRGLSAGLLKNPARLLLIILPLLLFLVFQPRTLSSQAFDSRSSGLGNELVLSRNDSKPSAFVINTEKRELIDWIRLFAQSDKPEDFVSLKAKVSGFVSRDEALPEGYFTIARYVISCCAADARPVGILVKYDPSKFNLKTDQWIELKGHFVVEEIAGEKKPVLELVEYQEIAVPDNPYIS
ncbi:TIGR03943 family protein [Candidatus Peregrinibacteria bacterium]|nr:TIGR03943 family protein [Candidatus Peregrinibacteria bacterium]